MSEPRRVLFATQFDFYTDDARRFTSQESDYGVNWQMHPGRDEPSWRVSYVRDTAEVYCAAVSGAHRILGKLREPWHEDLEIILSAWDNPDVTLWRIAWVVGRLLGAGAVVPCHLDCPLPYAPGLPVPCHAAVACMHPNPRWSEERNNTQ